MPVESKKRKTIRDVFEVIQGDFTEAVEQFGSDVAAGFEKFKDDFTQKAENFPSAVEKVFKSAVGEGVTKFKDLISDIKSFVRVVKKFIGYILPVMKDIWGWFANRVSDFLNGISELFTGGEASEADVSTDSDSAPKPKASKRFSSMGEGGQAFADLIKLLDRILPEEKEKEKEKEKIFEL